MIERNGILAALALGLLFQAPAAAQAPTQVAYAVRSDGDDKLYSINLTTGVATAIGDAGFDDVESLAFSPECETLYGVDDVDDRLVTCSLTSGACTAVGGPLGVDVTDTGLAFDFEGHLYMSTDAPKNPTSSYRLNPETGAATLLGNQRQSVTGLAATFTGIYGLGGDGANNLVTLSPLTGEVTQIAPLSGVAITDAGLDFDVSGILYGLSDGSGRNGTGPSQLFTVNLETGAAHVVANVTVGGRPANGFEGMAIAGGICRDLDTKVLDDAPTLSQWGLLALLASLAATGVLLLRRGA
ncbi:MAG TPA: hypothetical protein VMW27_25720 [Thermoanaerobaculia bacterium]|nr:hypothetical protein [Thermoanaerobaculia bacterium]